MSGQCYNKLNENEIDNPTSKNDKIKNTSVSDPVRYNVTYFGVQCAQMERSFTR